MLILISKLIESSGRVSYNLYDDDDERHEVSNWTLKEIRKGIKEGLEIKGFTGLDSIGLSNLRVNSYFLNVGIHGDKEHFTVVKRKKYSNSIRYEIVDTVGKNYELDEKDLIQMYKMGAVLSGVKIDKNYLIRISRRDVKTELLKK